MVILSQVLNDKIDSYTEVQLDGRILGYVPCNEAKSFTEILRKLKCKDITASELNINQKYINIIPKDTEVV